MVNFKPLTLQGGELDELADADDLLIGGSALKTQLASKITGSGVAKLSVGTTAPSSPTTGDLWIDTN